MDSGNDLGEQIIDLVSQEIGILAYVVFEETLNELGIKKTELTPHIAGKFIRVLDRTLPEDMVNKQQVIREVGKLLIKIR